MSISWQRAEPTPALFVPPPGAVRLDEAHSAIEQWEYYSGRRLDCTQRISVEFMLAEAASGMWAARTTARPMPRQNGKGDEIEVVEAWCLTQRAEAILHTAHEIPTAKSAHLRLVAHLEGHRDLRRRIKQVRYANGDQAIEMTNGGVIQYRTRTKGGGRGLDDISRLVVDEAQHAVPEQLASATPILGANPNPQTNFTGSAGIAGVSAWWWQMRRRALLPNPGSFAYLEHTAEQVSIDAEGKVQSVRPDPTDRAAWRAANPAYPHRLTHEFLEEQLRILGPELFMREHLGVWDPDPGSAGNLSPWPSGVWSAVVSKDVARPSVGLVYGVAVTRDRTRTSVVAAGGGGTVGLVAERGGVGWAVDEVVRVVREHGGRVALVGRHQAGSLQVELERAGVDVAVLDLDDYAQACAWFYDAVTERRVQVRRDEALDAAVAAAKPKDSGQRFVWARRDDAVGEIAALEAMTVAAWKAQADDEIDMAGQVW